MNGPMNADDFSVALTLVVPEKVLPRIGEVYFDAATQMHGAIVRNWPVDTGYSRAGFQATAGHESPTALAPRDHRGDYTGVFADVDAASASAIGRAAKALEPLTMGFVADYARYVEDQRHVVAEARAEWDAMVDRAVANASRGTGTAGGG